MHQIIDITDLTHPILTDLQKAAVAAAAANPVSLEVGAVLGAAREATGLDDFGAPDFIPRLALWLAETAADTDLSELGKAGVFGMAVTYATNRLRIEDLVGRHPEILDIVIDRPIFVAGLPRSGTTHLQNLLSVDQRLRELPMWEATAPVPAPGDAPTTAEPNPRRARAIAAWNAFDAIVPLTKNIHEMSPDYVSEDVELQCIDFASYSLEWRVHAPRWRDAYLATDQTPSYAYLKKVVQALTFLRGGDRWVLKCPQHMEQLVPLFRIFPDATVAITHRDPVASIQSALVGFCYVSRITRHRIDPAKIAAYWVDRYQRLLERCVRDRDQVPEGQVVDVYFDRLIDDPLGVMTELYVKAGLDLPADVRDTMRDHLTANPRGRHGQIIYNLKRDFALDASVIRERFADYMQRFPVRIEVT